MKQITGILSLVFFITGCATTTGPAVSSSELRAAQEQISRKAAEYRTKQLKRVEAIGNRLITYMPEEDRQKLQGIRYDIWDTEGVNAGATLDKKIKISFEMLRFCESDDELGLVIAHEFAHITRGHLGKKMGTGILATAAGIATGVALDSVAPGVGTAAGQVVSKGMAGGFSRDYEREADYFGTQYAYVAGFDPKAGSVLWERMSIELPKTATAGFFTTHPASPERMVRTEKIIKELSDAGIQSNLFNRQTANALTITPNHSLLQKGVGLTKQALVLPVKAVNQVAVIPGATMSTFAPSQSSSKNTTATDSSTLTPSNTDTAPDDKTALLEEQSKKQVALLKEEAKKRAESLVNDEGRSAKEQADFETALMEAKEAARDYRYAEFGIQEMGLAKKVTNLLLSQKVSGKQMIFPLSQKNLDWYVVYRLSSVQNFKALGMMYRHYRAYWYTPNGKLYSEQDFVQSQYRSNFAKTTLEWDASLGDILIGKWLVRIFQEGQLIDERTFDVIKV